MREPVKFNPIAPHHLYIGAFMVIMAALMSPHPLYSELQWYVAGIGILIMIDDVIEHIFCGDTPLRLFFETILVPLLREYNR